MTTNRKLRASAHLTVAALLISLAAPALANPRCSNRTIAGNWLFATGVGQQKILPGGDITALGTMNIDSSGNVSGKFGVTLAEFMFLPDRTYTGSVTVNPDCTGTLTFVTSAGTVRTDSIAVVNQDEIWGMSQDPFNLWTYKVRRIARVPGLDVPPAQ